MVPGSKLGLADPDSEAKAGGSTGLSSTTNLLACVSCRARKLKCDRVSPKCTRCVKDKNDCKYPTPQRKINSKRRNIKELQARLTQLESYLHDVIKPIEAEEQPSEEQFALGDNQFLNVNVPESNPEPEPCQSEGPGSHSSDNTARQTTYSTFTVESPRPLDVVVTDSLPSPELMEELNKLYFENYHAQIPIVHPGRFWQAFLARSQKRLPDCLMYSMWALASQSHPKYGHYSTDFYHRARRSIEADELKANNGWFITVPHAQTYAILATYEARCILFTSSAMSCAKCVRLINMMSLDHVDETEEDSFPMPWVEAEEKRRTFWGAFMIDALSSIASGLPSLINTEEIMTRLPASEDAFVSNVEEESPFLEEAFDGASYSRFSSTVIICHVFKAIMRLSNRNKPRQNAEDLFNGEFWVQHRELDNKLSTLFMFLPEDLQLPDNVRNLEAIHANLSFHACVISLHHIAIEEAEKYGHTSIQHTSQARLRAAAEEIVGIVKLTSHRASVFMSPLSPMSLYCALTVYVYLAKENEGRQFTSVDKINLLTVLQCMEAVGRAHRITKAFLYRACRDIEKNSLSILLNMPTLGKYEKMARAGASAAQIHGPVAIGRQVKHSSVLRHARAPVTSDGQSAEDSTTILSGDEASEECFKSILGAATRNVAAPTIRGARTQTYERSWASTDPRSMRSLEIPKIGSDPGSSVGYSSVRSRTNALQHQYGAMDSTNGSSTSSVFDSTNSGFGTRTINSDGTSPASFGVGLEHLNVQEPQVRRDPPRWPVSVGSAFDNVAEGLIGNDHVVSNSFYPWGMLDGTM